MKKSGSRVPLSQSAGHGPVPLAGLEGIVTLQLLGWNMPCLRPGRKTCHNHADPIMASGFLCGAGRRQAHTCPFLGLLSILSLATRAACLVSLTTATTTRHKSVLGTKQLVLEDTSEKAVDLEFSS